MTRGSTSLHRKTCFGLLWIGDLLESSMTFRVNVTGVVWCLFSPVYIFSSNFGVQCIYWGGK